jgi:dTDP-4-dehydrorhamnose 3,5-epimerase
MIFLETKLSEVFIIEPIPSIDERGLFVRTWCKKEFAKHGLIAEFVQCNISQNKRSGTVRGMHFQEAPYDEEKLIRCSNGAIYDVLIDLRVQSPTYKQWEAYNLSANNKNMLYVPKGLAHGFQTLEDNTEVFYQMSEYYQPLYAKGVRWDDPAFTIQWPLNIEIISQRDKSFSLFRG